MKRKEIEALEPKKLPKSCKSEWGTTVQQSGDIVIFNVYKKDYLIGRHCVDSKTGEYATWLNKTSQVMKDYCMAGKDPIWTNRKVTFLYSPNRYLYYYCYYAKEIRQNAVIPDKKDKELVKKIFKLAETKADRTYYDHYTIEDWFSEVEKREEEYARDLRNEVEGRRLNRVSDEMGKIPPIPGEFGEWCYNFMFGGIPGTATYHAATKLWYCSECHEESERDLFKDENGSRAKTNKIGLCPACGARVKMGRKTMKYTPVICYSSKAVMFNDIDDTMAVARFFDITAKTDPEDSHVLPLKGKRMKIQENIRVILYKGVEADKVGQLLGRKKVRACRIYYSDFHGSFDWKSNPCQRRWGDCMCFPNGEITDALRDTVYQKWAKPFEYFCATGKMLDYDRCMTAYKGNEAFITEMLAKGRFNRLFKEVTSQMYLFDGYTKGVINTYGKTANEVLGLKDTQLVNRLRDIDGGSVALEWLRFSESEKVKISQQALRFYEDNDIYPSNIKFIYPRMSLEQIMNYLIRQQEGSCKGMKISKRGWWGSSSNAGILERWSDYLNMAKDLGKKINDEMIFRPRDLAERHKEYVEECNKKRAIIQAKKDKEAAKRQAEEYRKKFPTANGILKDIKPKFEYSDSEYMIVVPKALTDIIFEGSQLHHCAGATDRYFDRIVQHETYICFLREKKHPQKPFYTIEVEPGGTIRQHRGMYDEEPDIDKIKPFLKEWQKEIRKRMKEEDKKHAEISKIKRAENIKELEAKGNLKVLKGLMEDFMDIEEEEALEKNSKKKKSRLTA